MWKRGDYARPKVQQYVGYLLLLVQAGVFAITEEHVVSPYLLAATTTLLSLGYLGESRKDFKSSMRNQRREDEREQGP